jgi:predicted type IV restriction endonuclease
MKNEGDVKKAVKHLLTSHGWFWWMPAANGFGMTGVADFCAVRDGLFMAIETKFGDNKPTAMQRKFLCDIMSHGGTALVVNEKTLGAFQTYLGQRECDMLQPPAELLVP